MPNNKTVYLCYRRDMCAFIALRVFRALVHAGFEVFMDTWKPAPENLHFSLRQITAHAHFIMLKTPPPVYSERENLHALNEIMETARYSGRNIIEIMAYNFDDKSINWRNYQPGQKYTLSDDSKLTSPDADFNAFIQKLINDMLEYECDPLITNPTEGEADLAQYLMLESYQAGAPTAQQLEAEAHLNLARTYDKLTYHHRAAFTDKRQLAAKEAFFINPEYADAHYIYALLFRNTDDVTERVHLLLHLDRAIQLAPERAEYYYARAWKQTHINDTSADMKQAICLKPAEADIYHHFLAIEYENAQDYLKAEQHFLKAIEINPRRHASHFRRCAEFYKAQRQFDSAINMLTLGTDYLPVEASLYLLRGQLYHDMGCFDAAADDFTYIIENLRNTHELQQAYIDRVDTALEQGDFATALADYSALIQISPYNYGYFRNRAELKRRIGDHEGAANDMKQMFVIKPKLLVKHIEWARIAFNGRDYQKVMADCEIVLTAYPDHSEAKQLYTEAVAALNIQTVVSH
jgi:tetratricopeptide (TPR) repeat protein